MTENKTDADSLHRAILNNDFERVERLIKEGADLNSPNENGLKPVHIAIMNNSLKMLNCMLDSIDTDKLADTDFGIYVDMRAWIYAIMLDNKDIAKLLIDAFGESVYTIGITNDQGETVLHYCAKYRSLNVLNEIVLACEKDEFADINQVDVNGYSALHLAVINNDVEMVKRLLELGANVYAKTMDGRSPIHFAVKHRCFEILLMLIEGNVDVNDPVSSTGSNALHIAVENNHTSTVNLLIRSGGNLHCTDNEGRNLLHVAVENNHEEMLKLLLKKNINVNARFGERQQSVLDLALSSRNDQIIKTVLNYNPDLNSTNKDGLSAIFIALKCEQLNHAKEIFLLKPDFDVITNKGSSLLHYAVKYKHMHIIDFLLENNINIQNVNEDGYNSLHYAAKFGDARIVTLLVNKNLDVNAKSKRGDTALHVSLLNDSSEMADIIKILLNSGADVNAENSSNRTPLFFLKDVKKGNENVLKLLLDAGADVNHFDKNGNGFLCYGTFHGSLAFILNDFAFIINDTNILLSLIEHKINFNKINSNNDTIFHLMAKHNIFRPDSFEFLLKNGVNINGVNNNNQTPLNVCLENSASPQLVTYLIKDKGVIANKNKEGESPLHLAIKAQEWKTILLLLENGAELSDVTVNGNSVFHYAVEYNVELEKEDEEDEDILKLLLKYDVNNVVNAKNDDGKTPLHLAAKKNSLKMVEVLFTKNIDININDKEDNSPLYYAIDNKNLSMVKLLLKKGACTEGKHRGQSIYDLAKECGNPHIYQTILLF